jgi:hypothetical protein
MFASPNQHLFEIHPLQISMNHANQANGQSSSEKASTSMPLS